MKTFLGVFLPTFVNLMGMTYWTRAGRLVGDCGIVFSLAIIWLSSIVSIILITSLSAMGTNGEIDAGGIHYVISRTIGPELGRCFTIFLDGSTCLAAAIAILGYAETIISLFEPKFFTGSLINNKRVIALVIMIVVLPLTKFVRYIIRIASTTRVIGFIGFILGCCLRKTGSAEGFSRPNLKIFKSNAWSHSEMTVWKFMQHIYTVMPGFTTLTGAFGNAGKLKRPAKIIPKGLWLSFGTSVLFWHVTIILIGFCGYRDFLMSGDISPIMEFDINKLVCFVSLTVFGFHRAKAFIGYEQSLITYLADDGLIPPIVYKFDFWAPLIVTLIFVIIGNFDFAKILTRYFS